MSRRLQAITFDAAGTLITVAEPVAKTYAAFAREHGASLAPGALAEGFRREFPAMPPMAFGNLTGEHLQRAEHGWWRALVRKVVEGAGGVPDFEGFFDRLYAHYARADAWRVYSEVPGVLETIAAHGIRIAVVSNFDSRLPGILTGLGIASQLESIVFSTAAGAAKPDRRIFFCALESLGVRAEVSLHVGDSYPADYRGAVDVGMQALYLQRDAKTLREGVPGIVDLSGLETLIAGRRA